jgi:ferredoxin
MPTLTLLPIDKAVEAAQGASALQAVLAAGVEAAHKCGGEGMCGSCQIFVHEGRKRCSEPTLPRSNCWALHLEYECRHARPLHLQG